MENKKKVFTISFWKSVLKEFVVFKTAWNAYLTGYKSWKHSNKIISSTPPIQWPASFGFILSGLLLFICFGTLSIITAINAGEPVLPILFVQKFPSKFTLNTFPHFWEWNALPTSFALIAEYGAIFFLYGFIVLSGGALRTTLTSLGLIAGCLITYAAIDGFNLIQTSPFGGKLFIPQFGYIIIFNYFFIGLSTLLGGASYDREKYNISILGICSIITTKLLSMSFGPDVEWFGGVLFYISAFFGTMILEIFIIPIIYFLQTFKDTREVMIIIETERRISLKTIIGAWKNRNSFESYAVKVLVVVIFFSPIIWGLIYYILFGLI